MGLEGAAALGLILYLALHRERPFWRALGLKNRLMRENYHAIEGRLRVRPGPDAGRGGEV